MKKRMPWNVFMRKLREANKDPDFVKAAKRFVNVTSHQKIYKDV
ncbi:MAG: hypothetical protein QME12_09070 [Nanoarchaeota archaeon]|nr:hypothetical protein [Nanoarchaeota archaeon]